MSPVPKPTPAPGFRLSIQGAHLADLIQISCHNRTRCAYLLRSSHGQGKLFFDAGRLVHAQCGDSVGLNAVVELLQWRGGEAVAINAERPDAVTIDMPSDALLLHAAQRVDEASLRRKQAAEPTTSVVCKVAEPPAPHRPAPPPWQSMPPPLPLAMISPATQPQSKSLPPPLPSPPPQSASPAPQSASPALRTVRMSLNGSFRQRESGASEALADRIFFAQRASASLGMALGLGKCTAVHLRGERAGLLVCSGESITGVEGPCEPLSELARKLGVS